MAPPKPRLVLRIGVSGHRPNRFSSDAQAVVRHKLDSVLSDIRKAAQALHERERAFFDAAAPEIRVISALAEGTDRVVAEGGLAAGFLLDVILPFPAAAYLNDFQTEQSRAEFAHLLKSAHACFTLPGERSEADPAQSNRAYEAAGLMTVRQCDLLIAVWDGKEASGRGGTEAIVQSAIGNGQPVLRFDEAGNGPWLLTGNEAMPSDARDAARQSKDSPIADSQALSELVNRLCGPPALHCERRKHSARRQLQRYLAERQKPVSLTAFGYPLILSLLSRKKGFWKSFRRDPYVSGADADWREYWSCLTSIDASLCVSIHEVVLCRYAWADRLADRYGQLHRSGYIYNYLLAALAVLFASLGEWWSPWSELAVITLITFNTTCGVLGQWHRRWLDYRQLSGQLRSLRALALTASASGEARSPRNSEQPQAGSAWVNWYCRLSAREVGLPNFAVDRHYVEIARSAIGRGELDDQIAYHQNNAARMESVAHWLGTLGHIAFGITFLVCCLEAATQHWQQLNAYFPWHELPKLLSIVLPAFGAALFGVKVHGEFKGSAERSAAVLQNLKALSKRVGDHEPMSFAELSALNEYAATIMASESGDWSFVYRARPLALPA